MGYHQHHRVYLYKHILDTISHPVDGELIIPQTTWHAAEIFSTFFWQETLQILCRFCGGSRISGTMTSTLKDALLTYTLTNNDSEIM